jgi:hypothetical protein
MPLQVELHNEPLYQTATIAASASLSGAVLLPPGYRVAAIVMPSAWTAADLTFQLSHDGTTYTNAYEDDGTEVTVTAAASRYILIPSETLAPAIRLKIRSGTSDTPVTQAAARELTVVTLPT